MWHRFIWFTSEGAFQKLLSSIGGIPPPLSVEKIRIFWRAPLIVVWKLELAPQLSFNCSPTCDFPCIFKLEICCPSQCIAKGLLGCKHWPMTLHVCERCLKLLGLLSQHNPNKKFKYCLVKYWLLILAWVGNRTMKCNNIAHQMKKKLFCYIHCLVLFYCLKPVLKSSLGLCWNTCSWSRTANGLGHIRLVWFEVDIVQAHY